MKVSSQPKLYSKACVKLKHIKIHIYACMHTVLSGRIRVINLKIVTIFQGTEIFLVTGKIIPRNTFWFSPNQ